MSREQRIRTLGKRFSEPAKFQEDASDMESTKSTRRRHSIYLDANLMEQVDSLFKEFRHEAYPQEITKSMFIEKLLERGMQDLNTVKEVVKDQVA